MKYNTLNINQKINVRSYYYNENDSLKINTLKSIYVLYESTALEPNRC